MITIRKSLTCEVVEDPDCLSGQGHMTVQVGMNKFTQGNNEMNIAHMRAEIFHRAGRQEVPNTPQQRPDQLQNTRDIL